MTDKDFIWWLKGYIDGLGSIELVNTAIIPIKQKLEIFFKPNFTISTAVDFSEYCKQFETTPPEVVS